MKNCLPLVGFEPTLASHNNCPMAYWDGEGVTDAYLDNLSVLQKWVIKIIYNKRIQYSSDKLFEESKL
ncbi:hypothetical protein NQ317_009030, partial [Molorchus minor]